MANGRNSGEQERKLEGGAAEAQPAPAPKTGIHPAIYIVYALHLVELGQTAY